MSDRPDYSPREQNILCTQHFAGTSWQTAEATPRKANLLGRVMVDPDVYAIQIEGEDQTRWLMACGNTSFDGSVIGTEPRLWIRECTS